MAVIGNMNISIVTVCRNSVGCLEKTIKSILSQVNCTFEYIVVDGKSTDGTIDIIKRYIRDINVFVSEEDNGVYDAMNKAVRLASGDYVLFMNAGDVFYSNDIVRNILDRLDEDISVLYGSTEFFSEKCGIVRQPRKNFYFGLPFCHQSSVTRRSDLLKNPFLIGKIYSDYNFYSKLYKSNKKFKKIDLVISKYQLGGISEIPSIKNMIEVVSVCRENFGLMRSVVFFSFLLTRILYRVLKFYLIKFLFNNSSKM